MEENGRVNQSWISIGRRFLVISGLLCGLGHSVYHTAIIYDEDNIAVCVKHNTVHKQVFPAVTICNMNPVQCLELNETLSKILFNTTRCPPHLKKYSDKDKPKIIRKKHFMIKFSKLPRDVRRRLGQPLGSMIRDCNIGENSCTSS